MQTMAKIKDAMERGEYPIESRGWIDSNNNPVHCPMQGRGCQCPVGGRCIHQPEIDRQMGRTCECIGGGMCVHERTDEDDNSSDEQYERSKANERYHSLAYGHHEE